MYYKRLSLFWFLGFVINFIIALVATFFWGFFSYQSVFILAGTFAQPFVHLLFAWLLFRKMGYLPMSKRAEMAVMWIVLNFVANTILLKLTNSFSFENLFTFFNVIMESWNFVAILVAGYLATSHDSASKRSADEKVQAIMSEPLE